MSHQDGLGNNGTEPTGLTKPDDGDDRVQKKSENVAHAEDRIRTEEAQEFRALGEFAYHTSQAERAVDLDLFYSCLRRGHETRFLSRYVVFHNS